MSSSTNNNYSDHQQPSLLKTLIGEKLNASLNRNKNSSSTSSSWFILPKEKEQLSSTSLPSSIQLESEKIIWKEVLGIVHHHDENDNNSNLNDDDDDKVKNLRNNYNFILDLDSSSIILPGSKEQEKEESSCNNNNQNDDEDDDVDAAKKSFNKKSSTNSSSPFMIQVPNIISHRKNNNNKNNNDNNNDNSSSSSFLVTHPCVSGLSIIIYLCERLRISTPRVQWTALWLYIRMMKQNNNNTLKNSNNNKNNNNKNNNSNSSGHQKRLFVDAGEASRVLYASACVLLSLKESFRTASFHVILNDPLLVQHSISVVDLVEAEREIFWLSWTAIHHHHQLGNQNFSHQQQQHQKNTKQQQKLFEDSSSASSFSSTSTPSTAIVDCYIAPSWLFRCFEILFELEPVLCRASGGLMLHWKNMTARMKKSEVTNINNNNKTNDGNSEVKKNNTNNHQNNVLLNHHHQDPLRNTAVPVGQDEATRFSTNDPFDNNSIFHHHQEQKQENLNSNNNNQFFVTMKPQNICTDQDEELLRLSNQITQDGLNRRVMNENNKNNGTDDEMTTMFHKRNNFHQQPLLPLPLFLRGSSSSSSSSSCVFSLMRELHKHNLISDKIFRQQQQPKHQTGYVPPTNSPIPSRGVGIDFNKNNDDDDDRGAHHNKNNNKFSSSSSSSTSSSENSSSSRNNKNLRHVYDSNNSSSILERIITNNNIMNNMKNNQNNVKNRPREEDSPNDFLNEFDENDGNENFTLRRYNDDQFNISSSSKNLQRQLHHFNAAMLAQCSRRPPDQKLSPLEYFRVDELYRRRCREATHQVSAIATMALLHACHFCSSPPSSPPVPNIIITITLDEIFSPFFPLAVFHSCGFLPVEDAALIFGFDDDESESETNNNNSFASASVSASTTALFASKTCLFSTLRQHVDDLLKRVPSLVNDHHNHHDKNNKNKIIIKPSSIIKKIAQKLTVLAFHGSESTNDHLLTVDHAKTNHHRQNKSLHGDEDDDFGSTLLKRQQEKKKVTKFLNLSAHSGRSSDGILSSALESFGL